jgi:hypothetical protein
MSKLFVMQTPVGARRFALLGLVAIIVSTLFSTHYNAYAIEEEHQLIEIGLSQAELNAINHYDLNSNLNTRHLNRAQIIAIDTSDQKSCQELSARLRKSRQAINFDPETFCVHDPETPTRLVIVQNQHDRLYRKPILEREFSPEGQELIERTQGFLSLGVGFMGLLYLLPESTTNWSKDEMSLSSILDNYRENVAAGPVWDNDGAAINYIGHSYAGSIYYVVARKSGFSVMKSFGYTFLMSTFFWEYGLEAFAEKPSKQDLLITPLLGAALGEALYHLGLKIEANDGKLVGSSLLGSVVGFIADPGTPLLNVVNNVTGTKTFQSVETTYVSGSVSDMYDYAYDDSSHFYKDDNSDSDSYAGIHFKFIF